MMLYKKNRYSLIVFIIITFLNSCINLNQNQCLENYIIKTPKIRHPSLVIINEINDGNSLQCKYTVQVACSIFKDNYFPHAVFYKNDKKFYLQFLDPKTKPVILFNLLSEVGIEKTLHIATLNKEDEKRIEKNNFTVILEKKLKCQKEDVYVFRVKNFFNYYEGCPDVVYFVTSNSGVIGSYFSSIDENGIEIFLAPAGNICKGQIDYSTKKERKFL